MGLGNGSVTCLIFEVYISFSFNTISPLYEGMHGGVAVRSSTVNNKVRQTNHNSYFNESLGHAGCAS